MILISPYSRQLKNGNKNPKNYPWWEELISLINIEFKSQPLSDYGLPPVNQLWYQGEPFFDFGGRYMNPSFNSLLSIFKFETIIISVDNFLPHFCHYYGVKCIVLWGQSDPLLFGYPEHLNILKDRKYLRANQYATWEEADYIEEAFASPEEVFNQIKHLL